MNINLHHKKKNKNYMKNIKELKNKKNNGIFKKR